MLNPQAEMGQKKTVVVKEFTDEQPDLAGVAGGCGDCLSLPSVFFAIFLTGGSGCSMRVRKLSPTRSLMTSSGNFRPSKAREILLNSSSSSSSSVEVKGGVVGGAWLSSAIKF